MKIHSPSLSHLRRVAHTDGDTDGMTHRRRQRGEECSYKYGQYINTVQYQLQTAQSLICQHTPGKSPASCPCRKSCELSTSQLTDPKLLSPCTKVLLQLGCCNNSHACCMHELTTRVLAQWSDRYYEKAQKHCVNTV